MQRDTKKTHERQHMDELVQSKLTGIVRLDYPDLSDSEILDKIPAESIGYLTCRLNGESHSQAIANSNSNPIDIVLWQKVSEFSAIMGYIKQAEAMMLESVVWDQALSNEKASIERMFALKSRMQEYKDNAQSNNQTITNVRITVNGEDYDTSATFKAKLIEGEQ